jgi:hypothetical protein
MQWPHTGSRPCSLRATAPGSQDSLKPVKPPCMDALPFIFLHQTLGAFDIIKRCGDLFD